VDDFGFEYIERKHAEHLQVTLEEDYEVSTDWTEGLYCGIPLESDYSKRAVDLSMPGYTKAALHNFQHPEPAKPENSPHTWKLPDYGSKMKWTPAPNNSPKLPPKQITRVQQIVGSLLFYSMTEQWIQQ
jgi:hypothetical protein